MNKNDEKILNLKKDIENKKAKISQVSRFSPVTNCIIEVDGIRSNIHTLDLDNLIALLVKLNVYKEMADKLELTYKVSGFTLDEWINDLQQKIDNLNLKTELKQLEVMEKTLNKLLSNEKQTEMEINKIEDMLKNNQ